MAASEEKASSATVLVAVDQGDAAMFALESYLDVLHKPGNKLILLHTLELPEATSFKNMTDVDMARMMKSARAKSQKLERQYATKLMSMAEAGEARFRVEAGLKPGEVICNVAKEEKANLIVIGSRGLSKVKRVFLGSSSHYVLQHSPCAVAICRDPQK